VSAKNLIGFGDVSPTSSTAVTLQTEPQAPYAPTRGALTTTTQIHVTWTYLTTAIETGGSAITSYHLQWDSNTNMGTWTDIEGLNSPYTGDFFV
jgi:hypothetical protein